jgi:hypothetical protein
MALTPELQKLQKKLNDLGTSRRTSGQDKLLAELNAFDQTILRKSLDEGVLGSVTKMTSPGDGPCSCCGK